MNKKIRSLNIIFLGICIFLLILFSLLFYFILPINSNQTVLSVTVLSDIKYDDAKKGRTANKNGIANSLELNGIKCAFDKTDNTFYYPIREDFKGKSKKFIMSFDETEDVSVVFFKNEIKSNMVFKIKINEPYKFIVFNEKKYTEYNLVFTTLPVISIFTDKGKIITERDVLAAMEIHDPYFAANNGEELIRTLAYLHVRGGASRSFPKKSYRVELVMPDVFDPQKENKNKVSLLGLRTDDDWILDAMFIDPARMRNKLSTDIWQDFGAKAYPYGISNGSRSEYAEVFLNDEYLGLYVLLERVDAKQLGANKKDKENGALMIKTTSWEYTPMNYYEGAPNGVYWAGFYMRYPKENPASADTPEKKITAKDWKLFYDLIQTSADDDKETFASVVNDMIFVDNVVDYWILVNTIRAVDNTGKNMFWTVPDRNLDTRFWITPWDLDLSWGITWTDDAKLLHRVREPKGTDKLLGFHFGDKVISADVGNAKNKLKARWTEIRKNVITLDGINTRIDGLAEYLTSSGAAEREYNKWAPDIDFKEEVEYMKKWFERRLPILDKYMRELR